MAACMALSFPLAAYSFCHGISFIPRSGSAAGTNVADAMYLRTQKIRQCNRTPAIINDSAPNCVPQYFYPIVLVLRLISPLDPPALQLPLSIAGEPNDNPPFVCRVDKQIHERVLLYRGHNAKFLEYFPDGTCRELERTDPLALSLLATTPFPGIQAPQVQQLMNTLRYFLFDLQNSVYELVPHGGPDQTLSNMVFYRQYPEGFGIIIPVQACTGPRYALPATLRPQLAQTALEDEPQLQHNFVASGNAYYLDVGFGQPCDLQLQTGGQEYRVAGKIASSKSTAASDEVLSR
ncbi:hypothetical protein C8F04DRAFT_1198324 [Mycena alexandri]|uniref:Uncharacterized protein n=1 Tax=Mycena alexandri TaxID=1745969 RepID=A0AAD6S0S4_9AGAR|nr:hypothetical protein C8F04DRAFT_1198324 [Mycena alexandri]